MFIACKSIMRSICWLHSQCLFGWCNIARIVYLPIFLIILLHTCVHTNTQQKSSMFFTQKSSDCRFSSLNATRNYMNITALKLLYLPVSKYTRFSQSVSSPHATYACIHFRTMFHVINISIEHSISYNIVYIRKRNQVLRLNLALFNRN